MNGHNGGLVVWHEPQDDDPRHRKIICDVPVSENHGADARLLASAPDLLAALEHLTSGEPGSFLAVRFGASLKEARAAIAAANGNADTEAPKEQPYTAELVMANLQIIHDMATNRRKLDQQWIESITRSILKCGIEGGIK